MFDLHQYLTSRQEIVNTALIKLINETNASNRTADAMTYSLMAGGKRLRPILCLAAAESVGGSIDDVIGPACALEMIHTYSLIHDDLPAMDNDTLRRGKPTCHIAFDEATAILAGDALLTLAFQTLSAHAHTGNNMLQVINIISKAAGYQGMIKGQIYDIESENKQLDISELENIHLLKTGALIEAAVCSGAILCNGTPEQITHLKQYARHIGLAFQVADDVLNIEGDPEIMGKSAGTDTERNKSTYPSIIGIEKSKQLAGDLIKKSLQAIELFDNNSDPLRAIAAYIIDRNK